MPEGSQDFSKIIGEIRREFFRFAGSYAKAVNRGANVTGKKIMKDLKKSDQPTDISVGKFISAVKDGVQFAGEEMAKHGADFVKHMKKKEKK